MRGYLCDECEDVICCTPESVYGFIKSTVDSMRSEVLKKKYQMYRAKLEVYENASNNRYQGER